MGTTCAANAGATSEGQPASRKWCRGFFVNGTLGAFGSTTPLRPAGNLPHRNGDPWRGASDLASKQESLLTDGKAVDRIFLELFPFPHSTGRLVYTVPYRAHWAGLALAVFSRAAISGTRFDWLARSTTSSLKGLATPMVEAF